MKCVEFKEDWNRVLNHIANLFYEDSVIQFTKDGANMSMSFEHAIADDYTITTAAKLIVDGQEFTSSFNPVHTVTVVNGI